MPQNDDMELRSQVGAKVSVSDGRRIRGIAIVFNSLSEVLKVGGMQFRERVAPGAVDRTLRKGDNVAALIDHITHKVLGRSRSGTLRMEKTPQGLAVVIDPPDTSYARDLMESMSRGDVDGMSFRFKTIDEEWDTRSEMPIRTITDMEFPEISVVTFPAYPEASAAIRSLASLRQRVEDGEIAKLRARISAPLPWEKTA